MATNHRFMTVAPEAVWAVLADPAGYGYWVVGSKVIRDADDDWPAPGSKFHHTVGVGPLEISDHTESLESPRPARAGQVLSDRGPLPRPPVLLRIRAKARPLGTARVTMEMTPRDGGTMVRMTENPDGLSAPLSLNPLVHVVTKLRNAESLMRLEELALRRAR